MEIRLGQERDGSWQQTYMLDPLSSLDPHQRKGCVVGGEIDETVSSHLMEL